MKVIEHVPPRYDTIPQREPILFLAGPIQGALDWQQTALGLIIPRVEKRAGTLHIANPRIPFRNSPFNKDQQLTWEKTHLRRAADHGHIIVWLAKESPDAPVRNKPGRAYAQTTRIEFGRAIGWLDYNSKVGISLGIEPGYKGNEDYYRHTAKEKHLKVFDSLAKVCANATNRQF